VLKGISSPEIRLSFLNRLARQAPVLGTGPSNHSLG
jgi:hypothetical protein